MSASASSADQNSPRSGERKPLADQLCTNARPVTPLSACFCREPESLAANLLQSRFRREIERKAIQDFRTGSLRLVELWALLGIPGLPLRDPLGACGDLG